MIVLDTHIWHWWNNQIPGKLSTAILALIEETDEVSISAISCFEMAWLVRHGRIDLDMPFEQWFGEVKNSTGIQILPVTARIGVQAAAYPNTIKTRKTELLLQLHLFTMPAYSVMTRLFPPIVN